MLENNSGALSRFRAKQEENNTEEIPYHKRVAKIDSKEEVAFSFEDMGMFGFRFVRKDILFRAYAKIFPSTEPNADNYQQINEYFFRKFYNRFDGYFFADKTQQAENALSSIIHDYFDVENVLPDEISQNENKDGYDYSDVSIMETNARFFAIDFAYRMFYLSDAFNVVFNHRSPLTVLFVRHRHNQRAYQFLAVLPQMRKYPRIHALVRFALLPPEYLASKWYAPAENVFMTPILSPIMKYLDANNIDIELPFLTRNAEYAPNADELRDLSNMTLSILFFMTLTDANKPKCRER